MFPHFAPIATLRGKKRSYKSRNLWRRRERERNPKWALKGKLTWFKAFHLLFSLYPPHFLPSASLRAKQLRTASKSFPATNNGILKPLIFFSQQREPKPGAKGISCLWRNNQIFLPSFLPPHLCFLSHNYQHPFSQGPECYLGKIIIMYNFFFRKKHFSTKNLDLH